VATQLDPKADEIRAARELGFTTVLATPAAGVLRGQSALVNMADSGDAKSLVIAPRAALQVANETERGFRSYPGSMMGAIALLRQSLYDARWYRSANEAYLSGKSTERPEPNASLDALMAALAGKQPVIYAAEGEQDFTRIAKIRDEFGLKVVAQGNGYEYRRAALVKAANLPVIVPLNFPAPPEVENPDSAVDVPLEQLQHWEQAPSNLATLSKAGIEFAVTANTMRDAAREFWPQLRLAIKRGLPADQALAALTTTPARLIGAPQHIGSLEPGRMANVVVANGDLFTNERAEIEIAFVDGKPYTTPAHDRFDPRGKWNAMQAGRSMEWLITGTKARPTLTMDGGSCDVAVRGRQVVVNLPCGRNAAGERQQVIAEGAGEALRGTVQVAGAASAPWSATRTAAFTESASTEKPEAPVSITNVYPAGAFGVGAPLKPAAVLVKNATVWTSAAAGKLESADLLVKDGRVAAIGKGLAAPEGALTIDAAGKHVTPGIIDAHSHTAITNGINEGSSSVTAEVRIGDVLNGTDINIYRELAGGVTVANVLHGSANTIGGQSQTIKMRWGSDGEGLKFANAMPGIKFALGENVKQSNWEGQNSRYPQTRMGVEQVLRDSFLAARHYQKVWAVWRAAPKGTVEPRRDLQLDTLVEILEKKRVVHIHSYRADEILMFARVAKEFGFTVATFQHVLEGYKVADAIASIGAGGSTFSDWWAYKMEVVDAIPTNGALMYHAGVLTTFNSDSDELARRLNTEAGKAVRYGGVPETEALKFVTYNAAKQLRIDNRVGSLEVGKDADFVIWNANPLSPQARAEQTWIEGQRYYDIDTDKRLRTEAQVERQRLMAKALPVRLARLAAPAGRPGVPGAPGGDAPAGPPTITDVLAFMALHRAMHQDNAYRGEYWNGGNWHECTEDAR
jgi:imidazolonepropionase-like amidohydrolase